MWFYKDRINDEQPELKKYVDETLLDNDWKDENEDEGQFVKNEKKDR
uniref:Calreticulin n=1 Tax=Meloidogyne hapla TaxID=6305 RepID=A0A1I8B2L9_MELHA